MLSILIELSLHNSTKRSEQVNGGKAREPAQEQEGGGCVQHGGVVGRSRFHAEKSVGLAELTKSRGARPIAF